MKKLIKNYLVIISAALLFLSVIFFAVNAKGKKVNAESLAYENTIDFNNNVYVDLTGVTDFAIMNDCIYYLKADGLYSFADVEKKIIDLSNPTQLTATEKNMFLIEDNVIKIFNENLKEVNLQSNELNANIYDVKIYNDQIVLAYEFNNVVSICNIVTDSGSLTINNIKQINLHDCEIEQNPSKTLKLSIDENYLYVLQYDEAQNTLTKIPINDHKTFLVNKDFEAKQSTKFRTFNINNKNVLIAANNISYLRYYDILSDENKTFKRTTHISAIALNNQTFTMGEIVRFTDFEVYNNEIYVLDEITKSIQKFEFKENVDDYFRQEETEKQVVLASSGYDLGRFNKVSKIFAQTENEIYVSDFGNKRLQIYNNGEINAISEENKIKFSTATINSLCINNKKEMVVTSDLGISFISANGLNYKVVNSYKNLSGIPNTPFNGDVILDVNHFGNIFALTLSSSPTILKWNDETETFNQINTEFLNEYNNKLLNAKDIKILSDNKIIVATENELLIINFENNVVEEIEINNIIEIDLDYFNNIYVLKNDNSILKLNAENNYSTDSANTYAFKENGNITHFSVIRAENKIVAYENSASKFIIVCNNNFYNGMQNYTHPQDIYSINETKEIHKTAQINTKTYAYTYPKNLGESYELLKDQTVIVLEELNNGYSYVLINVSNKLVNAYVKTELLNIENYNVNNAVTFVAINSNVKVYKYPTLLKQNINGNSVSFILPNRIAMNAEISVINEHVKSMEKSEFYAIIYGEGIGYINKSDCIKESDIPVLPLIKTNAHIFTAKALSSVDVYDAATENRVKIDSLSDGYKIIVQEYNTSALFTKISYYDKNFNLREGFIETKFVKMDKNNNWVIIFVLVMGSIVLITSVGIAFYLILKKKNIDKQKV